MMGLTKVQADVLQALRVLTIDGVAPSFEEIMAHAGIASKSSVHRILNRLEDRRYIRRMHYKARAIKLIDRDPLDGLSPDALRALRQSIDARLGAAA